jgi:hypothetical protein
VQWILSNVGNEKENAMKHICVIFFLLAGLINQGSTFAQEATFCVSIYDQERGSQCNSSSSYFVRIKNTCDQSIDMKYCLEKRDGSWACGEWIADPGDSTSYHVCDGTGRTKYWGRIKGSDIRFPRPPEFRS